MGHLLSAFVTSNPQFTGFGARLLRFVSFSRVSHFCKNVCLSTVEMSTVAQKRRGQNNETYVLAFQVFGDVKKTLFPRCSEISRNLDMFNSVQSRGRRDRGRLLSSCLTRKDVTERASRAPNSVNCGLRAIQTEKQICTNWSLNS